MDCFFDKEKNSYYEGDVILEGWPVLKASKNGAEFIPEIKLASRVVIPDHFVDLSENEKKQIIARQHWLNWCDNIPRDILKMTSPWKSGHWFILTCFQRIGLPAIELCQSNKGLFFALAVSSVYLKEAGAGGIKFIERYINKPRREIAGALGFPATGQAVKILSKIKASECTYELILDLRDVMMRSDRNRKLLSHLNVINSAIVSLMHPDLEMYTSNALFVSIANDLKKNCRLARKIPVLLKDVITMRSHYFEENPSFKFRSYKNIIGMHLELENFWGPEENRKKNIKLPEPPFKNLSDQIVPITSKEDLFEESKEMRNCVRTYLPEILLGYAFFYRVIEPRMIFLIRKEEDDIWQLVDIRGFANTCVLPHIKLEITEIIDDLNKNKWEGTLDLDFLKGEKVFDIIYDPHRPKEEIPF